MQRAFILCGKGSIGIGHLPGELTPGCRIDRKPSNIRSARELRERQAIRKAPDLNKGNRLAAACDPGIHKSALFRKMNRPGMGCRTG